jgi:hypothetical protein
MSPMVQILDSWMTAPKRALLCERGTVRMKWGSWAHDFWRWRQGTFGMTWSGRVHHIYGPQGQPTAGSSNTLHRNTIVVGKMQQRSTPSDIVDTELLSAEASWCLVNIVTCRFVLHKWKRPAEFCQKESLPPTTIILFLLFGFWADNNTRS